MPSESFKKNETIDVPKKLVYLGVLGITSAMLHTSVFVGDLMSNEVNANKLDLDKPVEVKSLDRNHISLEQDGKIATFKIDKLPDTVQKKLAEQFPHLKNFLGDGPINIVDIKK